MDYFLFHIFQNIEFVSYYLYRYPRIFFFKFLGGSERINRFNILDVFQSKADIFFFQDIHFVQWKSFHVCSGVILT